MNDFFEYFKTNSNTAHGQFNAEQSENSEDVSINIEDLDRPFTIPEVIKTISSMKRHKSCDYSNNVADFFIDSKDFISPYLVEIFNQIYGIYPDCWGKGVIIPIHKKRGHI